MYKYSLTRTHDNANIHKIYVLGLFNKQTSVFFSNFLFITHTTLGVLDALSFGI